MTGPDPTGRPDAGDVPAHAGSLLSAALDGELDDAERAWVEAHLRACADCRGERDAVVEARRALAALPTVPASPVIDSFVARHRTTIRAATAFVGLAAVAYVAFAATAAITTPRLVPDVAALMATHEHPEAVAWASRPVPTVQGPYVAPVTAGEAERRLMFAGDDVAGATYERAVATDGSVSVSVFEQHGRLDWPGLLATDRSGRVFDTGGRAVWVRASGRDEPVVAVTQVGDLVVTVVGDRRDAVLDVVGHLPPGRRNAVIDRVHDTCERVTQIFGLSG